MKKYEIEAIFEEPLFVAVGRGRFPETFEKNPLIGKAKATKWAVELFRMRNTEAITFEEYEGQGPALIDAFAMFSEGGDLLFVGAIDPGVTIESNSTLRFMPGDLEFAFEDTFRALQIKGVRKYVADFIDAERKGEKRE